ncbi:MAG: FAD-binding oxidoreductase [Anaerolineales bacterium]|nr:FAD-binding oxidoreductase [Anaerolineales bacterium]
MPTFSRLTTEHISVLTAFVGAEYASTRQADRTLHARDQSFHPRHTPEIVLSPATTEEVSQIAAYANAQRLAVTAWGAGTSLEGNSIPVCGGILINFGRMNQIITIRPDDFQVDVQPGITRLELNKSLAQHGLFFTPEPGANATIGGMIANNASGIKTIKYGATKDNVLRLEVVKADGEVIHVGSRARKDSSGYDLLHLFVGSEGTLGLITAATLKLFPIPADYSAVMASFSNVGAAIQTVVEIVGAGLEPSALEFLDSETVAALNQDKGLNYAIAPMVIMEFIGGDDTEGLITALEICKANGAQQFTSAQGTTERNKLWEIRHHTYESLLRLHPNLAQKILDVCVPISRYPELVAYAEKTIQEYGLIGYKFGHAGDGNLHINIVHHAENADDYARVEEANALIVRRALALEGTATGEHGVGIGKRQFMVEQHGGALAVMKQIKDVLDPNGILNPGKIFPE